MTNISRRRFFEDSLFASFSAAAAAAAAATLAGGTSPRPIFAQNAVAANDRLGVVIVGAGQRSHALGHFFGMNKRTKIRCVCDPDIGRARSVCAALEKKFGYLPEALPDFRKSLENKSIDIVVGASSNHWHALTAILSLQAGKHCYMEKPLTHNLHESKAIVAAAKKYGLVLQTGTQCRSTANVNAAVKHIRDGKIGDVKFVRGLCYKRRGAIGALGEYPIPPGIDYDLWSGPAQVKPMTRRNIHYDHHWQRYYGNGDLGNQGAHQLDISRWFLGIDRFPNSVLTYGGRLGCDVQMKDPNYRDAGDVANTSVTFFDFGDKSMVFEVRGMRTEVCRIPVGTKQGTLVGVIAYGSDGYVIQGWAEDRGQSFSHSYAFDKNGQLTEDFKSADDNPQFDTVQRHIVNFVDAVVANDPKAVTADARCGALSAAYAHLANMSYYLGENNKISTDQLKRTLGSIKSLDDNEETLARTLAHLETNGVDLKKTPLALGPMLKLDVEKEIFIDNAEATAMMTRDYRDGYVVPTPENV